MDQELKEAYENLMESFNFIKDELRRKHKQLYERWKAGGFIVDSNILSMYPNIEEIMENIEEEEEEEEEEY